MNQKKPLFTHFPVTSHTDLVMPGGTFVVIKGLKEDGTAYISKALEQGAHTIVMEHDVVLSPELEAVIAQHKAMVKRVENARVALALLSAEAAGNPAQKLTIFGITGTKGKTTTTWMLGNLLAALGKKVAFITTAGFFLTIDGKTNELTEFDFKEHLTTPQPDFLHQFLKLCVEKGVEYVVLEVAAQGITFHRLEGITLAGIIFTNLDREHAELYSSMERYFDEKAKIFSYAQADAPFIVNGEDEYGKRLLARYPQACSFGLYQTGEFDRVEENEKEKVSYYKIAKNFDYVGNLLEDTLIEQKVIVESVKNNTVLEMNYEFLPGTYNYRNFLAASALLLEKGFDLTPLAGTTLSMSRIPGRMEFYQLPNDILCCIDYAHTAASIEAVLTTLRDFTKHLLVVFGAGGGKDSFKRPLMGRAAGKCADQVIITTDNPRYEDAEKIAKEIVGGVKPKHRSKVIVQLDRERAVLHAFKDARPGSMIVLLGKGADEGQIVKGVVHPYSDRDAVMLVWKFYAMIAGDKGMEAFKKQFSAPQEEEAVILQGSSGTQEEL